MASLEEHRTYYARLVVGLGGSQDADLVAAFARVPREDFVGPGPWSIHAGAAGYIASVDADPRCLYNDVLVALAPSRGLNNGQPSLHARCLAAVAPRPGETVVQVGTGTGYYTAILAELVGPTGTVIGYELEKDLCESANRHLAHYPNVGVGHASATDAALPAADIVYVNAGATHPPAAWLDALSVGGRLVFPLTGTGGTGIMLLVTRTAATRYAAKSLGVVTFTPCIGARDPAAAEALAEALRRSPPAAVRSLRRDGAPDATAWHAGAGWWLSTAEPA